MKKFLIKTFIFFNIIAIIDVLSGLFFAYLVEHTKGGKTWRNNYICNGVKDDILIFGSSRALYHYNSVTLSDSLHLSCYNCGQEGYGIIVNEPRYQMILQRYRPKVLFYDITPGFDLLIKEDNHKYLGWLKVYYDRTGIPEVFESVDNTEKYKMLSRMYRYNSSCIQILSDYVHPSRSADINGFISINKEFDTMRIKKVPFVPIIPVVDSLKISYIKKMIDESTTTSIIFVISPWWNRIDTIRYQSIRDICKERNIPFIDFSNNPKYVHNNAYFADDGHLNARGADEFTKDLIKELREKRILNLNRNNRIH